MSDQTFGDVFKISQLLAKKSKPTHPQPGTASAQAQPDISSRSEQRSSSVESKPNFVLPKSITKKNEEMEIETPAPKLEKQKSGVKKDSLLVKQKKDEGNFRTGVRMAQKISTGGRVVFGGGKTHQLTNYEKGTKEKGKLLDSELGENDQYKSRKFIYPVHVKIDTVTKKNQYLPKNDRNEVLQLKKNPSTGELMPTMKKEGSKPKSPKEGEMAIETTKPQKDIIKPKEKEALLSVLEKELCFFQLPANLPIEGCYQDPPMTEDPDFDLQNKDAFSAFLEKKFDSTGFFLEREFKMFEKKEEPLPIKQVGQKKQYPSEPVLSDSDFTHETISIGKLLRLKDGSLKMKIGDNYFDLIEGVQDNFYKELFAVDIQKKFALNLLPVSKKIIIKPDLDEYLS